MIKSCDKTAKLNMIYCYEKYYSSISKQLRLERYNKRTKTQLYILRNNVGCAMSSFIESLRADFIVFRAEKSDSSTLTLVRERAVTIQAAS